MVNDRWGTVTPEAPPAPGTPTPTNTPAYLCGWSITTPTPANYDQLVMKTAQLAADRYAEIYKVIKQADPSALVYCCGTFFTREGRTDWWQHFTDRLKLYISVDDGATWTPLLTNGYVELLAVLPAVAGQSTSEQRVVQATPTSSRSQSTEPLAVKADSDWTTFLPLVNWAAEQPVAGPFTLFVRARNPNNESAYYRSDDGGVTWTCMELPTVQPMIAR